MSSFSSVRLCRREVVLCCSSSSFSRMVRAGARGAEMRESSCCSLIIPTGSLECARAKCVTRPPLSHDLPSYFEREKHGALPVSVTLERSS